MKIYYNISEFQAVKPVVTIGTFDGVHLGHHKVLDRLKNIAAQTSGETVVFTFKPHPRLVLSPGENNLRLLTTLDEKIELLEKTGVDHLIVFPFTHTFAQMAYSDFAKDILVEKLKTDCLVVGYDHRFGAGRLGGFDDIQNLSASLGFAVEKLDVFLVDRVNVSSTQIRNAIETGNILSGNKLLGYRYMLHGTVIGGAKIGRTMGFPTANIESSDINKLIPGFGVYAVEIETSGKTYQGMLNIGTRPTFNKNADHRSIEVNMFDFDGDLYGREVKLTFFEKIRNEQQFPDKGALIVQLRKDRASAQKILNP
ncbi:MAG: bifunctional riboflavin kinase/FAD synthetase [Prolixibacteraceae bacterium]|nr:bifunctional riboflavin kinase/FAD synthetase [Prolixibacteraceae bacterium]